MRSSHDGTGDRAGWPLLRALGSSILGVVVAGAAVSLVLRASGMAPPLSLTMFLSISLGILAALGIERTWNHLRTRTSQRQYRRRLGMCQSCGYRMVTGQTRCPECGAPFPGPGEHSDAPRDTCEGIPCPVCGTALVHRAPRAAVPGYALRWPYQCSVCGCVAEPPTPRVLVAIAGAFFAAVVLGLAYRTVWRLLLIGSGRPLLGVVVLTAVDVAVLCWVTWLCWGYARALGARRCSPARSCAARPSRSAPQGVTALGRSERGDGTLFSW
jgi:predicted RNA-binding Zn-ribbon protein involved in translation (DUF1610 family)